MTGKSDSTGETLRIVMVTRLSARADAILDSLAAAGVDLEAIVVDRGKLGGRKGIARASQVLRQSGVRAVARRVKKRLVATVGARRTATAARDYAGRATALHHVDNVNARASRSLLAGLRPDLIVLGASRILEREVIDIPRLGVLNAHPGVLPHYRGVDVVAWALLDDGPQGVTVHWVDTGIDTGAPLAQARFDVLPGDTLSSLHTRADQLAGKLMADVVIRLCRGETLVPIDHGGDTGRLYTRMSPADLQRVRQLLKARAAG